MNQVIQTILKRRSIRKYHNKPVKKSDIETILQAGIFAPTGADAEPWHLTAITNLAYLEELNQKDYPVIHDDIYAQMQETIEAARKEGNSVGGKIECAVTGFPAGVGNPFFDSIEAHLSPLLFSIPAVKSVSFGDLDDITLLKGTEANDAYYYEGE